MLGPIGLAVSLGVNLINIGARVYNGETVFPESDKEVLMKEIAKTNFKIDVLSEHMDNKLDKLKDFISL
jgi:hypothetical protein